MLQTACRLALLAGFVWMAASAGATPFWVAWEGETYPENEGWSRLVHNGGDERWFESGAMVLSGDPNKVDGYGMQVPLELEVGEQFVACWRVRVDSVTALWDPVVEVDFHYGSVILAYSRGEIYSVMEQASIPFEPGVFHEYWLTSDDMREYELGVDGVLAYTGRFVGYNPDSGFGWGDATYSGSVSAWDRVAFGVVPEPATSLLFGAGASALVVFSTKNTWRKWS
jgi:hypothetical protein